MLEWEVRKEFKYDPVNSWVKVNPYTIMFCRMIGKENFVVKGGLNDCQEFIRGLRRPVIVSYSYYRHKSARGGTSLFNMKTHGLLFKDSCYEIYEYDRYGRANVLISTKRLPFYFPKELEAAYRKVG